MAKNESNQKKILLAVLPFWDPLIPPMGISCLKSFLEKHGCCVKIVDANIEKELKEIYDQYFEVLKKFIPPDKRSNFYNIGKDVLRNHMMAHLHYEDEEDYIRLVKTVVYQTFFCNIDKPQVLEFNRVLALFFTRLSHYFLRLLNKEKPDVVGISVFKGTLPASLFAFRLTKKHFPETRTVMGGGIFADQLAPGSPDWELFLERTPYIDKIFIGEGELLFLTYLRGELPESQKVFTLKDINGEIPDISSAPIPDFSDFQLQYYPYLASYTSRGCPFQCTFCSETVRWRKYRKKSPQQVVEELITLYKTHGSQLFLMSDSLLNPVITDLSREIKNSGISVYWDGYLRVDKHTCDPEMTHLWRQGGFYRARLGVESGSANILNAMEKKVSPGQIRETVKNLAAAGIKTTTYWVIGYPGETELDFRQTLELVEELKNDIYEAEFNAFWYFESGQVKSGQWSKRSTLLYPGSARDMLILQTRILDYAPSREETYSRMRRFLLHCEKLGIPNPYFLHDILKADERWKKLHKNAVPPVLEFKDKDVYIDECKQVKRFHLAENKLQDSLDFSFG
jgi:radical SAM superfamily enzyme YgiQ (UPF0313 family)